MRKIKWLSEKIIQMCLEYVIYKYTLYLSRGSCCCVGDESFFLLKIYFMFLKYCYVAIPLEMYDLLFCSIEMHDLLVLISSIIGLCFFLCKTNKSMLNSIWVGTWPIKSNVYLWSLLFTRIYKFYISKQKN